MTTSAWNHPQDFMVGINNVGAGWHPIIKDLEERLNTLSPGYTLTQVKEKFGGLRYYAQPAQGTDPEAVDAFLSAINKAEQRADHTCERCGKPGQNRPIRGWYLTLCDEHRAEREEQADAG